MAEFDHAIKRIAEKTGRQLAQVSGVACDEWAPLESTLPITVEFLADRAFRARHKDESFVVYFEFYTTWNSSVSWDILAKSGILSQRERLPTKCIVIILQEKGYKSQNGMIHLEVGGEPTQQVALHETCLWKTPPEPWWEEEPGLMALYPLCHHDLPSDQAVRHAAAAIERKVPDTAEQRDFLTYLGIFGKLADPLVDVMAIIGREKMRESPLYQEILEEGREEGREMGREEGREEGVRKARRADILKVLRLRFGSTPMNDLGAMLEAIDQEDRLDQALDLAIRCASVDAFREAVQTL